MIQTNISELVSNRHPGPSPKEHTCHGVGEENRIHMFSLVRRLYGMYKKPIMSSGRGERMHLKMEKGQKERVHQQFYTYADRALCLFVLAASQKRR